MALMPRLRCWNGISSPRRFTMLNTLVSKRPAFPFVSDRGDGFYHVDSVPRDFIDRVPATFKIPALAGILRTLAPTPSHSVLDVCAAPGGKTAMLAQLMQNNGRIIATDSSSERPSV